MAHYPQNATGLAYATYPVGPAAAAQSITAGASNVKGSYTELVASLGLTSNSMRVVVTRLTANSGVAYMLDVATGAGGAETVVVPNILCDIQTINTSHHGAGFCEVPLAVASSTRVAVRCAAHLGGPSLWVSVTLVAAGGTPGVTALTNYGANPATTRGVSVDPGGTIDTKGSYAQLTASTAAVAQVIVPLLSLGVNGATTASQWAVDVATGAGGAETVLVPDLRLGTGTSTAGRLSLKALTFLTYIPASTRITARASCDITDATDRLLDAAVLVATAPVESSGSGGVTAYGFAG